MDVSIILVSYNTCHLTLAAIKSIYDYTSLLKFEIFVVDNDSKDDTLIEIKSKFPEVIIIANKKNVGFGRANNMAMAQATGKYLFLLNTDTYLVTNAVNQMFDFMEAEANGDVAVVGGKLTLPDGSWNVSSASFPSFNKFIKGSFWHHFYPKSWIPIENNRRELELAVPYEVSYVSGADFFVRKSVIERVGKFDERFFMYFEETELTLRIKRKIPNSKCFILPAAVIVHIGQASNPDKGSFRSRYNFLKSKTLYFRIQNGWHAAFMVYISGLGRLIKSSIRPGNMQINA
jgi:GT2 family glycosyltransferase